MRLDWRRNLAVLFVVQLLSTAGFSMVFPFLPLYVKEVGVATRGSLEFWSGMVFSAQAVTMMIAAPIWGAVSSPTVCGRWSKSRTWFPTASRSI